MIGLTVFALAGFGYGKYQHNQYIAFKAEVENIAKAQEAHVESIKKQHELVTKGISDEFDAKLSLIRQYYSNGVRQPSTSSVSSISNTASVANANTAYAELAGNCAQTTLQLVELQKWYMEVAGIK
jgi:hypothetical protein